MKNIFGMFRDQFPKGRNVPFEKVQEVLPVPPPEPTVASGEDMDVAEAEPETGPTEAEIIGQDTGPTAYDQHMKAAEDIHTPAGQDGMLRTEPHIIQEEQDRELGSKGFRKNSKGPY